MSHVAIASYKANNLTYIVSYIASYSSTGSYLLWYQFFWVIVLNQYHLCED